MAPPAFKKKGGGFNDDSQPIRDAENLQGRNQALAKVARAEKGSGRIRHDSGYNRAL